MLDKYRELHIQRIIHATSDLYKAENSICKKCHNRDTICCIFCYCPLYEKEDCGGNYTILHNGIKDCSECERPHTPEFVKKFLMNLYKK